MLFSGYSVKVCGLDSQLRHALSVEDSVFFHKIYTFIVRNWHLVEVGGCSEGVMDYIRVITRPLIAN